MNKLCSENIGTPDVFVYNSGIFVPELCINNSSDRLQQTIDVNLKPAVDFIREIAPQMMMRKKGKIFLMSSVNGRKCFYNGHANYAISKAGLDALVRQAAMEFSRHGILINAIAPGMVETEMTRNYLQEQKSRNRLSQLLDRIALHRLGRAEEIANFVFALSQPEVDYITGQTFCIDGGFQL
jgi:3-oxoacyl-[acyl-carrier protein] reductase